jgi:hypothetical protein
MPDLDLFGEEILSPAAPYRETYDPDQLGCADCIHVALAPRPTRGKAWAPDRCKVSRREIDADFGTCGRAEARKELIYG